MGRPLRRQEPGTTWLVTNRCHQARLLLRPDAECRALSGIWLARALARHPGIRLLAYSDVSNHLHALVLDGHGELSSFCQYYQSNLAKALNRLRRRSGSFFARRYSAEPVLDKQAELERLLYVAANPQRAGLVETWRDWPGLLVFAGSGEPEEHTFEWLNEPAYRRALRDADRTGEHVERDDYVEVETLVVHPIPDLMSIDVDPGEVARRVQAREHEIRRERVGRPVKGAATVKREDPRKRPRRPKRSPRPRCHTSNSRLSRSYMVRWRQFVWAYVAASEAYREGVFAVRFPAWSFPPHRPLVREGPSP